MKRTCLVIVIWFALTHSFAFAQDEKTELAVFAGGYFNSGFQSFKVLNPTTGARLGTFKPVSEANSGIFGVRSSYNFRPQMAAEATFGFSPAGRSQNSFPFGMAVPVLVVPVESQQAIPIAVRSPVLRDGNVYLYSGTLLTYFNQRGTWRPFFTVGAGGITRTSKIAFVQNPPACSRASDHASDYFSYTCSSDHSNGYGARAWHRIQEILSARIGSEDGFPRSHQQIRSEHSQQYGIVARIIHSLLSLNLSVSVASASCGCGALACLGRVYMPCIYKVG